MTSVLVMRLSLIDSLMDTLSILTRWESGTRRNCAVAHNKKAPRFPGGLLCNCLAIEVSGVPHLPPDRKQRKHHFLNRSGQRIVASRREVNITRLLQTSGRTRYNSMEVIDRDV